MNTRAKTVAVMIALEVYFAAALATVEAQTTTHTDCYQDSNSGHVSCSSRTLPTRRNGWGAALEAFAQGFEEAAARKEQERIEAQNRALQEQYLVLVNAALDERAARVRALDEDRRKEAEAERKRSEAAYRLFQPKLAMVARRFIDSLELSGVAHRALLDELMPIATDIFLATPNAGEGKIREDLQPLFAKFAQRAKDADGTLGRWIVARKASLTSLTGKARDKLVTVVEEEYDRAVAGHVETLNTKEFDDILKSIAENQALCLSIDGNCDEDLLSPVQLRRRNQIYQSAARKRTLEFAAIEKEAERYAAKMRNWPRSLASVLAVRSQSVLQDRAIGVTTNIANLVATEGQMLRSAVEECRSGRSCVRTEVGDEVFSTFKPAMSERYQKICGSSASIGDCRVLSVSSDRPGESVRLGGVVAGVTPLLAVISPRVDVVLSVGDGDWRIDTTVRIVNDFPELSASVVTSLDPGKSSVPSRAALESTMAKDLPSVPLVNRFTLAAPARPSRSRMTAIWGIGTLVSGALFAATCDRSLCTPVIGFRDGVTLGGGVFMPAILWGSLRGYRKEVSVFNARKLEHENLIAGRDSVVARRLRMLDSAHEAESKRIRNLRPIRSFSFDQKLGRH